jgi:hypothetical protein
MFDVGRSFLMYLAAVFTGGSFDRRPTTINYQFFRFEL